MEFTLSFLEIFGIILKIVTPIVVLLLVLIVVLGQIAGRLEKWPAASALHWSFITATTVGYGDIRPQGRSARILAVAIAFSGLILFGVIAAVAVSATTHAVRLHADLSDFEKATGKEIPEPAP